MASQAKASSSSADSHNTTAGSSIPYDVFLNFRGEDTRKGFTGHLHRALSRERLHVFMDSYELWEGEDIGSKLVNSIQGSKISISVFSKGYANSKWCLKELVKIVECHTSNSQIVLPIFFDVDPSDVRHQNGSFEEAFLEHEKNLDLPIVLWRDALNTVGNMKGWVLSEVDNGNESKVVELVVERILSEVVPVPFIDVTRHIGLDSQLNSLQSLFNFNSTVVQYIGICGIGGIGKTTIAKAIYDSIVKNFRQYCFLANIREEASRDKGLVPLQEELIFRISKRKVHGEICNVEIGSQMIKVKLNGEKILLVLDDVDQSSQLDAFGLNLDWLGEGSTIIITTRDKKILETAKIGDDKIYCPVQLDDEQSLRCFSLHAFQRTKPLEDYMELSCAVAKYSGGLPLTLEVLGSYLSVVRNKETWESTIQQLRLCGLGKVFERLKISYDNLENKYQKDIFLDSACFFVGWERETVLSIWESLGFYPKSAIERLTQRSLLRFEESEDGCYYLKMHDQIQNMGKEFVSKQGSRKPGKRSRLCSYDEISEVLEGNKGTDKIESIVLLTGLQIEVTSRHFEMMSNLRLLISKSSSFSGDFSRLPYSLRYFRWNNCSFDIEPSNFYHKGLNHLDLSFSMIKQAWITSPNGENKFHKLRVLNLSHCEHLWDSPSFLWFPCLERLDLGYCRRLYRLDESIGELCQLKSLNLKCCGSLREELPDSVRLLEKLEELDVSGCTSLVRVADLSMLKNLRRLNLRGCLKLKQIQGVEGSKSLENMEARDCDKLTRHQKRILRQGSLRLDGSEEFSYPLNNNQGLVLCIVFEFIPGILEQEYPGTRVIYFDVSASICQDDKTAKFHHTVRLPFTQREGNIIYIHHFEGFDWFGFPLQGKDAIKNLDVRRSENSGDNHSEWRVKFWKLLSGDPEQQMLNIEKFFTCSNGGEEVLEIAYENEEKEETPLRLQHNKEKEETPRLLQHNKEKEEIPRRLRHNKEKEETLRRRKHNKEKEETPLRLQHKHNDGFPRSEIVEEINNSFLFSGSWGMDTLNGTVDTPLIAYLFVLFAFICCVRIYFLGP